ncbi:MAG: hypothetical protein AAF928_05370 [Myxococcota bacterium]
MKTMMKVATIALGAASLLVQTGCAAPLDEEEATERDDEVTNDALVSVGVDGVPWVDDVAYGCTSPFRGQFERYDDGRTVDLFWKDACAGDDLQIFLSTEDPEQPLWGPVPVSGRIEAGGGILALVSGDFDVDASDPGQGSLFLIVERPEKRIGHIEAQVGLREAGGRPDRVDGTFERAP